MSGCSHVSLDVRPSSSSCPASLIVSYESFVSYVALTTSCFYFAPIHALSRTRFTSQSKCLSPSTIIVSCLPFACSIHDDSPINTPLCGNQSASKPHKVLYGNYAHHSQFFVFIGVTDMIYVAIILIFYICLPDRYNEEQTPKWVSQISQGLPLCPHRDNFYC